MGGAIEVVGKILLFDIDRRPDDVSASDVLPCTSITGASNSVLLTSIFELVHTVPYSAYLFIRLDKPQSGCISI